MMPWDCFIYGFFPPNFLHLKQKGSCKATDREPAAKVQVMAAFWLEMRRPWLVGGGWGGGGWNLLQLILGLFCWKPQITRQLLLCCPTFGPKVKMLLPSGIGNFFIFPSSSLATCSNTLHSTVFGGILVFFLFFFLAYIWGSNHLKGGFSVLEWGFDWAVPVVGTAQLVPGEVEWFLDFTLCCCCWRFVFWGTTFDFSLTYCSVAV